MPRRDQNHKVFGIGLSRTGTKSLSAALGALGIRTKHYPYDATTERELFSGSRTLSILDRYQAITDISVVPFFRHLDAGYPGSRFILTTRDEDAWLESVERHYGAMREAWDHLPARFRDFTTRITRATYGTELFDEPRFRQAFREHLDSVTAHFASREGDLLTMDVTDGDGWRPLAPFLGLAEPDEPFPRLNKRHVGPDPFTAWREREARLRDVIHESVPTGSPIALLDGYELEEATWADYVVVLRDPTYSEKGTVDLEETVAQARRAGARWLVVGWMSPAFGLFEQDEISSDPASGRLVDGTVILLPLEPVQAAAP